MMATGINAQDSTQSPPAPPPPPPPAPSDTVYNVTQLASAPEFPGGQVAMMQYLGKNVKYPVAARERGIQGKVYVGFVINEFGNVQSVRLLKGITVKAPKPKLQEDYDKAARSMEEVAMDVIRSMPDWKPGVQKGKPVKVSYVIPINFHLQ